MAEELENETIQQEVTSSKSSFNEAFNDLPGFVEKNKKALSIGGGAIAVLIAAIVFATVVWLPGREKKAQEAMFMAQIYFEKDSFEVALNGKMAGAGERPVIGFKEIASKYSFTKAATLANYSAGICCKNLKKYDEAITYLGKGDVNDPILGGVRLSALGDVYMDKKDYEKGISNYEKAANYNDNDIYTPYYLFKAGMACEVAKKPEEAKKFYTRIQEEYPRSQEGNDIEKYITRVSGGK